MEKEIFNKKKYEMTAIYMELVNNYISLQARELRRDDETKKEEILEELRENLIREREFFKSFPRDEKNSKALLRHLDDFLRARKSGMKASTKAIDEEEKETVYLRLKNKLDRKQKTSNLVLNQIERDYELLSLKLLEEEIDTNETWNCRSALINFKYDLAFTNEDIENLQLEYDFEANDIHLYSEQFARYEYLSPEKYHVMKNSFLREKADQLLEEIPAITSYNGNSNNFDQCTKNFCKEIKLRAAFAFMDEDYLADYVENKKEYYNNANDISKEEAINKINLIDLYTRNIYKKKENIKTLSLGGR